jgi:hypothetical protein
MKQTREELIAAGHFARLRHYDNEFIRETLEEEAAGKLANPRYGYLRLVDKLLRNGCITLILGEGDDQARGNFQAAVEYALKLIAAPPTPGGGLRVYEANVELSEQGSRLTALHERKPQQGEEKLSITDYHRGLICVACFGDLSQFAVVASVPEEAYQYPGTVASADHWARVRAWKALLLGRDAEARREAEQAFAKGSGSGKAEAAALLALLDGEQDRFNRSLQDAVKQYVKATAKQVNDPITAVFFPGLMLCRMAIDRGMPVEDAPYLPVRLLPHYQG